MSVYLLSFDHQCDVRIEGLIQKKSLELLTVRIAQKSPCSASV